MNECNPHLNDNEENAINAIISYLLTIEDEKERDIAKCGLFLGIDLRLALETKKGKEKK